MYLCPHPNQTLSGRVLQRQEGRPHLASQPLGQPAVTCYRAALVHDDARNKSHKEPKEEPILSPSATLAPGHSAV